eukprot:gene13025-biopygen3477
MREPVRTSCHRSETQRAAPCGPTAADGLPGSNGNGRGHCFRQNNNTCHTNHRVRHLSLCTFASACRRRHPPRHGCAAPCAARSTGPDASTSRGGGCRHRPR